MTFVAGKRARPVNFDSFAELTDVPVAAITTTGIDFDGDLSSGEVDAIWWWMTSKDDTDEAARRDIAALLSELDASGTANPQVKALLTALTAYVIGDPNPAPPKP